MEYLDSERCYLRFGSRAPMKILSVCTRAGGTMNRSHLLWGTVLLILGTLVVLHHLASKDIVVLYTKDVDYHDRYTTLWVIAESRGLWIRAAKPDRRWLADIRPDRNVRLERDGSRQYYRPVLVRNGQARDRVDRLMRQKYGIADRLRELLLGRDTVAVQLTPVF